MIISKASTHPADSGWHAPLAVATAGLLLFLTISGLAIWLLPFSVPV